MVNRRKYAVMTDHPHNDLFDIVWKARSSGKPNGLSSIVLKN